MICFPKDSFLTVGRRAALQLHQVNVLSVYRKIQWRLSLSDHISQFELHLKRQYLELHGRLKQKYQKVIERHIWEDYIEEAEHLRHTQEIKSIYARRKETIERVFADAKEKHGMRWTTLRGLKKLSMQAMLTFAAMNLKKTGHMDLESAKMA